MSENRNDSLLPPELDNSRRTKNNDRVRHSGLDEETILPDVLVKVVKSGSGSGRFQRRPLGLFLWDLF